MGFVLLLPAKISELINNLTTVGDFLFFLHFNKIQIPKESFPFQSKFRYSSEGAQTYFMWL